MKPVVFVSRKLPDGPLSRLREVAELRCWSELRPPDDTELATACADCDGLLCMLTDRIDSALLAAAPRLRVVSTCSVGYDHVDVDALNQRQIPLGYTPHVLVDATADLTFALLLSAARRIPEAEQFVRRGEWTPERRWEPDRLLGKDLNGATLGILGLGAIGQAMARRAHGFGMQVLGWTPSQRQVPGVRSVSREELLRSSEFVSLHLALSPQTHNIIDAEALARMRSDAWLVNTARGGLVDEVALYRALLAGEIGGAALDVFAEEPLAVDHPLLALPNVVVTSHIGSATAGTRLRMAELAVDNLIAGLRGERMPQQANLPSP